MVKFSGLSHNGEKKINPRLAWMILQKIYRMYCNIKNKEEGKSAMIIKNMPEHEQANKVNK